MKRLICITGIILVACVCVSTLYAPVTMAENTNQVSEKRNEKSDTFIITAENGRIVVFRKGETAPFIETDTYINNLPKGDILQIKNGIEVQGESKLRKSLEDYCS